jgi:hypothetical protein
VIQARTVIYYAPKHGNAEAEWEDGGASSPGGAPGRGPRFAVADGATQGFGSARWAQQLVAGFIGADHRVPAPDLARNALLGWFAAMQSQWRNDPRLAGATDLEKIKMEQVGSFATFLGCEIADGAGNGARPRWTAIALGDTVLFHVRGGELVAQFPRLAAADFGYNPDGVSTRPEALHEQVGRVRAAEGELADGDLLYVATDALAHWMVEQARRDPGALWPALASLSHPDSFRRLVADRRAGGDMGNDDVTLLRAKVVVAQPAYLVVCL